MADGSITFATDLDNKELEKKLQKTQKEIAKQEKIVAEQEVKKSPLITQAQELEQRIKAARAEAERYGAAWEQGAAGADKQQSDAIAKASQLEAEHAKVVAQIDKIDKKLLPASEKLDEMKAEAGALEQKLAEAAAKSGGLGPALDSAEKYMDKFVTRVKGLARRVFVFTVITTALRSIKDWMGKVMKTNTEATAAFAKLKGALLTLAQPLVEVIVPAFTALVNVLAAIVGRIAELTAVLFGTTADQASKAAESLYEQTEALEGTGAAAKKASKSLASFDEINKLSGNESQGSGGSTSEVAPDFSWMGGTSDLLKAIADDVLLIASGLALWKISDALPGMLGTIGTTLSGLMITIGGLILLWDGLSDAWENGVDWTNMIAMISGAAAAAVGLYLAFGNVGGGIGLLVSGIAMIITGFKDMIDNGMNLQNTLLTIAGIIATGLGIYLLTGNLIPLVLAGIASIGLALVELMGNGQMLVDNLKLIFSGFVTFIQGLVTGDINKVLEGLKTMVKGAVNVVLTIVGSLVNAIIKGINWLIDKINSISISVPDWVPGIGGMSWSPSLPSAKEWDIPQLAQGAVIPPNREFLAVLGDQKSGTNIETPLSTMVQAFKQAMGEMGGGGDTTVILEIDGQQFGKAVFKSYNQESRRVGVNLAGVRG